MKGTSRRSVKKMDEYGMCVREYGTAKEAATSNGFRYKHFLEMMKKGEECGGYTYEWCKNLLIPEGKTAGGFHATHNPYSVYTLNDGAK